MRRVAALAVLPLVAVTACGGGGLPDGLKVAGVVGRQPTVTIPASAPSGKLKVETLHKGRGAKVTDGDLVVANYVGYRWNGGDHKLVASSFDAGRPAMFPYGRLVTGLNRALEGQRPGGRVLAVIPPGQGYGANGYAPWQIGAGDSMVFVLDVIATYHNAGSAQGQPQPQNDPALPQVTAGSAPTMKIPSAAPPGRLRVKTIIQGSGPPVQAHQLVVFHDLGQVWRTGNVFESTRARGLPDSVVAGAGQMINGWDRAVVGQRVGSRVLVIVPPKDGYGAKGHAASGIKKGDTLAFVIDVLAAY
ncbi:FKBP-type peptidyl-prolyl cis-trans isomerase [Actinoallomurus purpureus]|uniref:FKBP-type peptidyl-prolyl cis-trans isomerase n=1 Tax=Actinoallomurus purpureus TaxID=478114 RepID=UPI00209359C2|nr:FKBP-type peptidyl-prolyl cis-trans isomerase [Actinoallomurus purpureus]MCO6007767.1 FKBP-type peptidyl-prolyl cis-trans isomerase [Actinoallomurus purpureus]